MATWHSLISSYGSKLVNVDMTRRITRSMARQGQMQIGALMVKEELKDEDSQVFNVFQIQELDL